MVSKEELEKIVHSAHSDPFQVLGAHLVKGGTRNTSLFVRFCPMPQKSQSSKRMVGSRSTKRKKSIRKVFSRQPSETGTRFFPIG